MKRKWRVTIGIAFSTFKWVLKSTGKPWFFYHNNSYRIVALGPLYAEWRIEG